MLEFLKWAGLIYLAIGVFFACIAILSIVASKKNPFEHIPIFLGLFIMFIVTTFLWLPASFKSEMKKE